MKSKEIRADRVAKLYMWTVSLMVLFVVCAFLDVINISSWIGVPILVVAGAVLGYFQRDWFYFNPNDGA